MHFAEYDLRHEITPELTYDIRMPILVYDADCGFCTRSANWIHRDDAFDLRAWPFMDDLSSYGLTTGMVQEAAHWCSDGKVVASGADAIGLALRARGGLSGVAGRVIGSSVMGRSRILSTA